MFLIHINSKNLFLIILTIFWSFFFNKNIITNICYPNYIELIQWKLIFILNDVVYNLLFLVLISIVYILRTTKLYWFFLWLIIINFDKIGVPFIYNSLQKYWIQNNFLTNGLSLLHPFFVYLSYIFFLKLILLKNFFFKLFLIKKYIYIFLKNSFYALLLGSWWANQEASWGGWWNWDFVEIILLVFFFKYLIITHYFSKRRYLLVTFNIFLNAFFITTFFYFVRLNILSSIHTFNVVSIQNKYIYFIFYFYLFYFLFNLIKWFTNLNNFYKYFRIKKTTFKVNLFLINQTITVIIAFILLFFLYNLFLVSYFNKEVIDLTIFLKNTILLLISINLTMLFIKEKKFFFTIFIIYTKIEFFLKFTILILFSSKEKIKNILHILINLSIIILYININLHLNKFLNFSPNSILNLNFIQNFNFTNLNNWSNSYFKPNNNLLFSKTSSANIIVDIMQIYSGIDFFLIYTNFFFNILIFNNTNILFFLHDFLLNSFLLVSLLVVFFIFTKKNNFYY